MKQVVRKGLKHIIVDEVPDPMVIPHHVLVRPIYSLISSGTETARLENAAGKTVDYRTYVGRSVSGPAYVIYGP